MMIIPKLNYCKKIPILVPQKKILSRLGYSQHRTRLDERQHRIVSEAIAAGFMVCEPSGVWCRVKIHDRTETQILLENDVTIESQSLCKLLNNSIEVLVMGATVGKQIMTIIQDAMTHEPANGVVYDAVGSETADAALQWMQDYLRLEFLRKRESITKRRFSPGYGDLKLDVQKVCYDMLKLNEIGIELTERFMLIPEKSVLAIAGIEKI